MTQSIGSRTSARQAGARAVAITASLALAVVPLSGALASDNGVLEPTLTVRTPADGAREAAPAQAAGLIITSASTSYAPAAAAARTSLEAAGVETAGRPVAVSSTVSSVRFAEPKSLDEATALAAAVAELPGVASASPDVILRAAAQPPVKPTDQYFDYLHNLWDSRDAAQVPPAYATGWPNGGYSVKAPVMWQSTMGSPSVVVAILDTGRTLHPDLDANTVDGYDFVSFADNARDNDGRDPNPADEGDWSAANECYSGADATNSSWHGTHVAGTVAARTNDNAGVVGVAPNVKVQHVRVLAKCGGSTSDIAAAITWASGGSVPGIPANKTPAKILNLSLGGQSPCVAETQDAINGARKRGSVVIVAAGNDSMDAALFTPANCEGVITVAATDVYGFQTEYSNFGGGTVDLSAPGGEFGWGSDTYGILSTINLGTTVPAETGWTFYQGTSMATPAVAGSAALIASLGSFTAAQLEQAVRAAVRPFPTPGSPWDCDATCGRGILDLSLVPAPRGATTVSGTYKLGKTLTGTPVAAWLGSPTSFSYQWLRNGTAISGATSLTYKVTKADIGKRLQFRVLASKAGFPAIPSAASSGVVTKIPAKVTVKLKKKKVSHSAKAKVVVKIKTKGIAKPKGKIRVTFGKKSKTVTIKPKHKGKITVTLPKLKKGTYKIKAKYTPKGAFKTYTSAKTSKVVKLKIK